MKPVTPALLALLASKERQFVCADLFEISRSSGDQLCYCNIDVPVIWDGNVYSAFGVQPSGIKYRTLAGLEADEQTLTLNCSRDVLLGAIPFLDAVRMGQLDGATVVRKRAYFDSWETPIVTGLIPVGVLMLFSGYVSKVDSLTRYGCELRVKSDLARLDTPMPRNTFQASCMHTLYDAGCTLSKVAYGHSGTVGSGSSAMFVKWSGAMSAYYWGGTILFTSGQNAGISRSIKNSDGLQLTMAYALPNIPAEGDAFTAYPGCDHTTSTCDTRFSNLDNFRACPYIPTSETAL